MGDTRFARAYAKLHGASDRASRIRGMGVDELIMALAAAVPERDPLLVNIMATELQNRARRSLAVAEHIGEAVLVVDEEGIVTYANPAAEALFGKEAEEVVGRDAAEICVLLDARREPCPWEDRPTSRALATGQRADATDLWLVRPDGREVAIEVHAAPIRKEGATLGAVTMIRDVTKQREAADLLGLHKRLLDAVGQAVMATRPDGTILYWNRCATEVFGWEAPEVIGRNVVDVTPTNASREEAESLMRRLSAGESWSGIFQVRRKDGVPFRARVTNSPVLDAGGRLIAIIGISEPLTPGEEGASSPATAK